MVTEKEEIGLDEWLMFDGIECERGGRSCEALEWVSLVIENL